MIHNFPSDSANDLWNTLSSDFCSHQSNWKETNRNGIVTKELLHVSFSIANSRQRWIQARPKAINIALSIAEVIWIITGRSDSNFLKAFFPSIIKFAGNEVNFHGAYGNRLRQHFGIGDQLQRAYEVLLNDPLNRQVVLTIWDPSLDLPNPNGSPQSKDIPCNIVSLLKIRNDRLEWMQIMRSNDLYKGLPNNIVQFTSLQEILAGWLGVEPGEYNHVSDSLHVYEHEIQYVKPGPNSMEIQNGDNLSAPKQESDLYFNLIAQLIENAIWSDASAKQLTHIGRDIQCPDSYKNLLHVLVSELIRRKKDLSSAQERMSLCTNANFRLMWNKWMLREHPRWSREQDISCVNQ